MYSYIGRTVGAFTGNVQARLISISDLTRVMREDKELENNNVTVKLADTDGYFSTKLTNADQYVRGKELAVYDDDTLLFSGYIESLPESEIGVFTVTASLFDALDKKVNKKLTKTEFPDVDDENAGQWGNYIFGHVCDMHVKNPVGDLLAYRVDTRKYLAAWHYLWGVPAIYNAISETEYQMGDNYYHISNGDLIPYGNFTINNGDGTSQNASAYWTAVEDGGTVTYSGSDPRFGSYNCVIDSTGIGETYVHPLNYVTLAASTKYYLNFWHKTNEGRNMKIEYAIKEISTSYFLQSNGTWAADEYWFSDLGNESWNWIHKEFTSNTATEYRFIFGKRSRSTFTIKLTDISLGTDEYTYIIPDTDLFDEEITMPFNAYGYPLSTAPSHEDGIGYLTNPLTCLETLNTLTGDTITFDGLDEAETEATTRDYVAMISVTNEISWKDFFTYFAINYDLNIWQKINGDIGLKMLNWGNETSSLTINATHIIDFSNKKDITKICARVRRMYSWHNRKQYFAKLPIDVISTTSWEGDDYNLDLRWTEDNDTALDVAGRYRNIYQNPLTWFTVTVDKELGSGIELADVVTLIYPKGYYPNKELLVQVFKKTYNQSTITLELLYIDAINDGVFRLWADTDASVVLIHEESDEDCEVLL